MKKEREIWVDQVKLFACVLVVLGHFLQSMVKSDFLFDGVMFQWFDRTVYMFHVPLFFICSGYLYQKTSNVNTWNSWLNNVVRKFISLGIPYFTFSVITWLSKTVFSDSVNQETDGLLHKLFVIPESPYWYLYVLFFLFCFIPTFSNKRFAYITICIAFLLKIVSECGYSTNIYFVSGIMQNSIWFVLGMLLCFFELPQKVLKDKRIFRLGISVFVLFAVASVFVCYYKVAFMCVDFVLGFLACVAIIAMTVFISGKRVGNDFVKRMSSYTMPLFLMHTIFAAGLRIMLLKAGIENSVIHVVFGLLISFVGPILVVEAAKRIKFVEFFFYPSKFIKISI